MADTAICPTCEPDNPAARYADMCAPHRVEDNLPVHYFDCERFNVSDYGTRQGKCDCTATEDVRRLLDLSAALRKFDADLAQVRADVEALPLVTPSRADRQPPTSVAGAKGGEDSSHD